MISTFQRNRHFRKVPVNKTFTHVQEQKKAMSPRHSAYIPSSVKSPLSTLKKKSATKTKMDLQVSDGGMKYTTNGMAETLKTK